MERRRNNRFSANKFVGIEYPGGMTFIGWARDVSFGGLFVKLDMADLPAHALAQLLVPIEDEETGSCLRIPVAITRHTREGIGLLYCVQEGSKETRPTACRRDYGRSETISASHSRCFG